MTPAVRRLLWWTAGFVGIAVLGAALFLRGSGSTARREPFPFEERIARASWRFLVPREVRSATNPVAETPEVMQEALEHWADHCAVCHANDGSGASLIGRRVFPPVPDMRQSRTQNLTDGELFYAIEQGIPWTAMPAWTNQTPEGEVESWKLVRLVRRLPALTPADLQVIESFTPRSPAEEQRDREIDDFLSGKDPGTPTPKPHQHGKGGK